MPLWICIRPFIYMANPVLHVYGRCPGFGSGPIL